ncbi:unnamed protein product [Eruca vesicaria subsp. sativa]|uniref:Uncharacterized protein n=1 Tax=Eruca vesicaria subsp. sativa TaxID=29727 RepID=A0ABC8KXM0_ERUVS|nr:unnamed protein product [Eruca vesicaria subsp. sativa]
MLFLRTNKRHLDLVRSNVVLSPDVQSKIAPASSEPYAITTVRGTKAATSSQARPHEEAYLALRELVDQKRKIIDGRPA